MNEEALALHLEGLQKSMDGNVLALEAVSEVLSKMDSRLAKAEEMDEEEEKKHAAEMEMQKQMLDKEQLIKDITSNVIKQLIDLHGNDPVQAASKDQWPMNPNDTDAAVAAKPRTATEEVQRPIQAMEKQEAVAEKKDEMPAEEDHDEEGAAEYPMEEEEYKEHPNEYKALAKQFANLQKEFLSLLKSKDVSNDEVEKLAEKRFNQKMKELGYHKEIPSKPRLVSKETLGLSETQIPLVKSGDKKASSPGDVTDQLASMSWADICDLKMRKMMGQTDGLPQELLS